MSQRIKVIRAEGLWAPRLGCEGVIIEPTPAQARLYPFSGKGKNEVVILLDNDPLGHKSFDYSWSCVISRDGIEFLP